MLHMTVKQCIDKSIHVVVTVLNDCIDGTHRYPVTRLFRAWEITSEEFDHICQSAPPEGYARAG